MDLIILAGSLSIGFVFHGYIVSFRPQKSSCGFWFSLYFMGGGWFYVYLMAHYHSEFCMNMNDVDPFICCYDINAVALPKFVTHL